MLSKKSFVAAFEALDDERNLQMQIDRLYKKYAHGEVCYANPAEYALRDILHDEMDDTNYWISWWYDGYRVIWWVEGGEKKEKIITKPEELYDFLVDSKSKTVDPYQEESGYISSLFDKYSTEGYKEQYALD